MVETNLGNFNSCCRLCLSEKLDNLKSVFDDAIEDRSLQQKILVFLAIEINSSDKISTMICHPCIAKVNNWHKYKQECCENQSKLELWAKSWQNTEVGEMSFQIKDEPADHDDVEIVNVMDTEEAPVIIKSETVDNEEQSNGLFDATAPSVTTRQQGTMDEDSQGSESSFSSRKCTICNKLFSSTGNRKKHEKQIHGVNHSIMGDSDVASSDDRSQNSVDSAITTQSNESDQQKIQFAAGLKLLQKDSTPISFEALSKIELSYIEKCKAMVHMYTTLECSCHEVQHPNLKGLLSHLRALRIWFPVFTCYNCMISFTDRSTYTKHHLRCPRTSLETITKLSNLKKRSEIKTRLYQNYKCKKCKFMYSFHDEFCKHVDEEHISGSPPYICSCKRSFDNLEDYKDHIYVSCMVLYYCDICFVTVHTLDQFKKHAEEMHDNSEGFILLQDDDYKLRKSLNTTPKSGESDEAVIVTGKRRSSFYNRRVIESEEDSVASTPPPGRSSMASPTPVSKKKGPQKCPMCPKEYSNYPNMMRHYRQAHQHEQQNGETNNDDSSYYSCPDCSGMYNAIEWKQHLAEKHEIKTCGECGKAFQFQTELDQHRSVHLNLKVYRDSKTKSYKSTMLSPNPDGTCDSGALLCCDFCDKIYVNKEDFENHKIIHQDEILATAANIKTEKTKDTVYECKQCDKKYSGYGGLWDHNKRKHPNIKTPQSKEFPKKCKYCDKEFYTGGSYYMHKQMHERMMNVEQGIMDTPKINARPRKSDDNDEDESYHTCKRCFKVFSSKYNLKNHMKSHGINLSPTSKSKPKKAWCDVCHTACESNEALAQHKIEEHGEDEAPPLENEFDPVDGKTPYIFTCDVCVMTFTSKMALRKHKEKHLQEDIKPVINKPVVVYCKYCKVAFNSVDLLNEHMEEEHAEPQLVKVKKEKPQTTGKPHVCHICRKGFSTAMALCGHIGWHKRGTGKYGLKDKHLKMAKHAKLIKKINDVAPQEPITTSEFQCTTCLAELPNDTALQIHILEKHRNVNAIMLIPRCNTCNQDFKSQEEYDNHKRLHDLLEQQQIQTSPVKTQSKAQLIQSKQMQLKQQIQQKQMMQQQAMGKAPTVMPKNFPCTHCPAAFSRQEVLTQHIRQNHTPIEFKCNYCDRVFDKQNSLSIHLKVHEKQTKPAVPSSKPLFSCSICSMGFDLPKDLRAHTINVHPF